MKRPRLSLRTLLILVALVGMYFGCWELTKRNIPEYYTSPGPFVVKGSMYKIEHGSAVWAYRIYSIWIFGYTKQVFRGPNVEVEVNWGDPG